MTLGYVRRNSIMTVLIVTFSQDNESIPLVIKEIEARGEKAFRFDTDRYPTEVKLDIYSGDTERVIITDGEQKLDLSEVSSVWYRRMRYGQKIPVEKTCTESANPFTITRSALHRYTRVCPKSSSLLEII